MQQISLFLGLTSWALTGKLLTVTHHVNNAQLALFEDKTPPSADKASFPPWLLTRSHEGEIASNGIPKAAVLFLAFQLRLDFVSCSPALLSWMSFATFLCLKAQEGNWEAREMDYGRKYQFDNLGYET